jgi:hypothetical protein
MKYLAIALLVPILAALCTITPTASDTAVTSLPEGTMPARQPSENPVAPKPGDENLTRGAIFLHEASLVIRESFPPQISIMFSGDLPTPCHELRAILNPPDDENKIIVDAYSVVDPNMACIQVLQSFQGSIDLGTFPTGHYTVWINDNLAGEFDT